MGDFLSKLKDGLNEVEKIYNLHADSITQITTTLSQLTEDKVKAERALDVLSGARQTFEHILSWQAGNPLPLIKDGINLAEHLINLATGSSAPAAAPVTPALPSEPDTN